MMDFQFFDEKGHWNPRNVLIDSADLAKYSTLYKTELVARFMRWHAKVWTINFAKAHLKDQPRCKEFLQNIKREGIVRRGQFLDLLTDYELSLPRSVRREAAEPTASSTPYMKNLSSTVSNHVRSMAWDKLGDEFFKGFRPSHAQWMAGYIVELPWDEASKTLVAKISTFLDHFESWSLQQPDAIKIECKEAFRSMRKAIDDYASLSVPGAGPVGVRNGSAPLENASFVFQFIEEQVHRRAEIAAKLPDYTDSILYKLQQSQLVTSMGAGSLGAALSDVASRIGRGTCDSKTIEELTRLPEGTWKKVLSFLPMPYFDRFISGLRAIEVNLDKIRAQAEYFQKRSDDVIPVDSGLEALCDPDLQYAAIAPPGLARSEANIEQRWQSVAEKIMAARDQAMEKNGHSDALHSELFFLSQPQSIFASAEQLNAVAVRNIRNGYWQMNLLQAACQRTPVEWAALLPYLDENDMQLFTERVSRLVTAFDAIRARPDMTSPAEDRNETKVFNTFPWLDSYERDMQYRYIREFDWDDRRLTVSLAEGDIEALCRWMNGLSDLPANANEQALVLRIVNAVRAAVQWAVDQGRTPNPGLRQIELEAKKILGLVALFTSDASSLSSAKTDADSDSESAFRKGIQRKFEAAFKQRDSDKSPKSPLLTRIERSGLLRYLSAVENSAVAAITGGPVDLIELTFLARLSFGKSKTWAPAWVSELTFLSASERAFIRDRMEKLPEDIPKIRVLCDVQRIASEHADHREPDEVNAPQQAMAVPAVEKYADATVRGIDRLNLPDTIDWTAFGRNRHLEIGDMQLIGDWIAQLDPITADQKTIDSLKYVLELLQRDYEQAEQFIKERDKVKAYRRSLNNLVGVPAMNFLAEVAARGWANGDSSTMSGSSKWERTGDMPELKSWMNQPSDDSSDDEEDAP